MGRSIVLCVQLWVILQSYCTHSTFTGRKCQHSNCFFGQLRNIKLYILGSQSRMHPDAEGGRVCWRPVVSATNYCKLDGLKQQKFILSYFQRLEVQIKVQEGLGSLLSLQGESVPCPSQLLVAAGISWHVAPISNIGPVFICLPCVCVKSPSASHRRTLVMASRVHPDGP